MHTIGRSRSTRTGLGLVLLLALVAAACGDDGGDGSSASAVSDASVSTTAAPATTTTTTPAPTTSEAPEGQVLLDDGFRDNSSGWLSAPEPSDTPGLEVEVVADQVAAAIGGGALGWSIGAPGAATWWPDLVVPAAGTLGDQRVEAEVSMTAPGWAGVACRIAAPGTADLREYDFTVSAAGVIGITELDEEGNATILAEVPELPETVGPDTPVDPAFPFEADRSYALAFDCIGGADGPALLVGYLDGEEVLRVEDPDPIPTGVGGLVVGNTELLPMAPFEISFSGFRLTNWGAPIDLDELAAAAPTGFTGTVSCSDAVADLADDKGNPVPADGDPATDLTLAQLTVADGEATVTFEAATPLPLAGTAVPTGREVRWAVVVFPEAAPSVVFETIYLDGAYQARTAIGGVGAGDGSVSVDGDRLVVTFPLESPLPAGSRWSAYTEWYPSDPGVGATRLDDLCPDLTAEDEVLG